MNYKIIGQDGRTYGPVSLEQLREWIAQGRVDARTAVWVEGAADWSFAGLRPELAGAFNTPPPLQRPPPPSLSPLPPPPANRLATWSLVCGLLAWTCCCGCLPLNLAGLALGIIALVQISSAVPAQEGRGLAVAGVVLSAAHLLWVVAFAAYSVFNRFP